MSSTARAQWRSRYPAGRTFGENLVAFGLAEALDGKQRLLGSVRYGLDGVEAGLDKLLDVGRADARALPDVAPPQLLIFARVSAVDKPGPRMHW